jgi:hypothetical protein
MQQQLHLVTILNRIGMGLSADQGKGRAKVSVDLRQKSSRAMRRDLSVSGVERVSTIE